MENLKFLNDISGLPQSLARIFSGKNQSRLTLYFFKKYFFSQCSKLFSPKFFTVSFKDKTKNISQPNAGFSLVELVVVVAIIGVLATIAVPQFNKFVVKAKRTEAKSSLSALYTAVKGFKTLYGVPFCNFLTIGFQPEGEYRYIIFTGWGTDANLPNGIAPEIIGDARLASPSGIDFTSCYSLLGGNCTAPGLSEFFLLFDKTIRATDNSSHSSKAGAESHCKPSEDSFLLTAFGDLDGNTRDEADGFRMNDKKVLVQSYDDIENVDTLD